MLETTLTGFGKFLLVFHIKWCIVFLCFCLKDVCHFACNWMEIMINVIRHRGTALTSGQTLSLEWLCNKKRTGLWTAGHTTSFEICQPFLSVVTRNHSLNKCVLLLFFCLWRRCNQQAEKHTQGSMTDWKFVDKIFKTTVTHSAKENHVL